MSRPPPGSTRTAPLCPSPTLFRSALLEAAHVAADFVAGLLGRMHPQAVVIAGKEAGDGLRRTHAMVLAAHAAFPEAARRRAVLEQPALAGRQVGRSIR